LFVGDERQTDPRTANPKKIIIIKAGTKKMKLLTGRHEPELSNM
jgi:hypothetical protein